MSLANSNEIKDSKVLLNEKAKNVIFVKKSRLVLNTYDEYKKNVTATLSQRSIAVDLKNRIKHNLQEILAVFLVNFDPVHNLFRRLYSFKNAGNTPIDPQIILRSFLLMKEFKETRITAWANRVKSDYLLALFCGTTCSKAPSVGSYYELFKRLENGFYHPKCDCRILPSEQRRASKDNILRPPSGKPEKKPDYLEQEHGSVILNYANNIKACEEQPAKRDLETVLNEILALVAVVPSVEAGHIKSLANISVSGDGSTLASYSDSYGKPTCDCHKQGIYKCDHLRKFSDPDATWGWNNRVKDFVFGYRYFQFVVDQNKHDFPVYLNIGGASTHEAKMAIRAIDRVSKLKHYNITTTSFDALYDIYAFYRYLYHKKIGYVIPYAKQPAKCISLGKEQDEQLFTNQGIPVCPGGLSMLRTGLDKQGRQTYHCPIKRMARKNGGFQRVFHHNECPLDSLCEPDTKMGPLVHVEKNIDLRIHPAIPRNSKQFKELSKSRTCTERSNAMKKSTYQMKTTRMLVMNYAFVRLTFISILEHSRVWAKKAIEKFDLVSNDILDIFC